MQTHPPTQIRVRVVAPRGTRVLVEVVEFGAEEAPGLPPITVETTGVEIEGPTSEPPPAPAPALRLVRPEAA